ncbi:TfoX/Sxy family DNA transformation protein [Kosakonia sp. BYX6]|uniref:TfoX/Sxy family DNA transformation protein n=1 Tax=Kosakonia calanthes TaxID=3139408 RepID=A0ABZ3B2L4_9ENTR
MEDLSYQRIYQSREYLNSLGQISYRAHFGGYSLSVDRIVFAMVAEGELYLRACDESAQYAVAKQAPLLMFNKRGRQLSLNYYFVSDSLWGDRSLLLQLSTFALDAARREKAQREAQLRLRDLPNLSCQLEILLHEAGIQDAQTLRMLGAKVCWLRLRKMNKQLSVKVLFALEGAIVGVHEAALPANRRQELIDWFNDVMKKGANPF